MQKKTDGKSILTREFVKDLAYDVSKSMDSTLSYADIIFYWADSFENLALHLSDSKTKIDDNEILIPLVNCFFYDFVLAHKSGYLIEGGYRFRWRTRDKRVFLDTILNANKSARNAEEEGDTFLQMWGSLFESVSYGEYDLVKIIADVFKNQDVVLSNHHLIGDYDENAWKEEYDELKAMYESQNKIGG